MSLDIQLRWMLRRDMPQVLCIETASFDLPWTEGEFLAELRERNVIAKVAEIGEQIVGYIIYELHKTRLVIVNMAVHPGFRYRGIGRRLVENLIDKLSAERRSRLVAHVWERNLDAHLFFRAMGFECVGVERGFEFNGDDAYRFVRRVQSMEVSHA